MSGSIEPNSALSPSSSSASLSVFPYNSRFQHAILASADAQLNAANEIIQIRTKEIRDAVEAKTEIAIELGRMREELKRNNSLLANSALEVQSLRDEKSNWKTEKSSLENELRLTQDESQGRRRLIEDLLAKMGANNEAAADLRELTRSLAGAIKVHQAVEENFESKIKQLESSIKNHETRDAKQRQAIEKSALETQRLESLMTNSVEEIKTLNSELSGLKKTLASQLLVDRSKDRQISEMFAAMDSRDRAVKELESKFHANLSELEFFKAEDETKFGAGKKALKAARDELEAANTKMASLEKERDTWRLNAQSMKLESQSLIEQFQLQSIEIASYKDSDLSLRRDLEAARKEKTKFELKLAERNNQLTEEREKIHRFVDENDRKTQLNEKSVDSRITELQSKANSLELEAAVNANKTQVLSNENASLLIEVKELRESNRYLGCALKDVEGAEKKNRRSKDSLEREFVHLQYREVKAEAKIEELKRQNLAIEKRERDSVRGEVDALRAELEFRQSQISDLNSVFLTTQEKVLEAQREHRKIEESTKRLMDELKQIQWAKNNYQNENQRLLGEQKEFLLENAENSLKLQLKGKILAKSQFQQIQMQEKLESVGWQLESEKARQQVELGLMNRKVRYQSELASAHSKNFIRGVQDYQLLARRLARLESELNHSKDENQRLTQLNTEMAAQIKAVNNPRSNPHSNEFQVENSIRFNEISLSARNKSRSAEPNSIPNTSGGGRKEKFRLEFNRGNSLNRNAKLPAIESASGGRSIASTAAGSAASSFSIDSSDSLLISSVRAELYSAQQVAASRLNEIMRLKQENKQFQVSEQQNIDNLTEMQTKLHEFQTRANGESSQIKLVERENERLMAFCLAFEQQLKAARVEVRYQTRKFPSNLIQSLYEKIRNSKIED